MFEVAAFNRIRAVKRNWQLRKLLALLLMLLSAAICLMFLFHSFFGMSFWWFSLIIPIGVAIIYFTNSFWKFSELEIAHYLNEHYPILEESVDLLLIPAEQRSVLEALQVEKISQSFLEIKLKAPFSKLLQSAIGLLIASALISILLLQFSSRFTAIPNAGINISSQKKEVVLPEIKNVLIRIDPPGYTGKKSREQSTFSILAEAASNVVWKMETNQPLDSIVLILNDSAHYRFANTNKNKTEWQLQLTATVNGIYQIKLPNKISEHFALELIRDLFPMIQIQSPKQYTVIDYGEPKQLSLVADVKDDYGIVSANLVATVASGGGEAVKFKEHQFALMSSGVAVQQTQFRKKIDLNSLNMQPGDELYYYIKAVDNHQQEARSDIYILKLTDTAELKEMNGMLNAINVKPDYFRSQRQIIIETEQLLRDQDTISAQAFKSRSNELGVDQKLLRLRYGKFLGEESEGNIGDSRFDTDEDHASGGAVVFGDANAVIEAYSHKHDNAEDASFFDAETKKQLKAVLTEMWGSELKLRTFFPKEALPYQYKALRLLKELQQSSRAYVAKTNVKTTPLKFEKRLTGELTKILPQQLHFEIAKNTDTESAIRKTMGLLLSIQTKDVPDQNGLLKMQVLLGALNRLAIDQPASYLLAYESFKRLYDDYINQKAWSLTDWLASLAACEKILERPANKPGKQQEHAEKKLTDYYFHHLNDRK